MRCQLKRFWIACLFILASYASAQTCTPGPLMGCTTNLKLWVPSPNYANWSVPLNLNWIILDTDITNGTYPGVTPNGANGLNITGTIKNTAISSLTGQNCVQVDSTGLITNTGSPCGSGGGSDLPLTGGTITGPISTNIAGIPAQQFPAPPDGGWDQAVFIPSANNPTSSVSAGQGYLEVESDGSCQSLNWNLYTVATDALCESWSTATTVPSLPTASYVSQVANVQVIGGVYYYSIITNAANIAFPAQGSSVYMWVANCGSTCASLAAANTAGWTKWNNGNPIFGGSGTTSGTSYFSIQNFAFQINGSNFYATWDGGTTANSEQGSGYSYWTGCALTAVSACNLNTNATVGGAWPLTSLEAIQLTYDPTASALIVYGFQSRTGQNNPLPNGGVVVPFTVSVSAASTPATFANWKQAINQTLWSPNVSTNISDPRVHFSPTAGLKPWNAIMTYDANNGFSYQAYVKDEKKIASVHQLYLALTAPTGSPAYALFPNQTGSGNVMFDGYGTSGATYGPYSYNQTLVGYPQVVPGHDSDTGQLLISNGDIYNPGGTARLEITTNSGGSNLTANGNLQLAGGSGNLLFIGSGANYSSQNPGGYFTLNALVSSGTALTVAASSGCGTITPSSVNGSLLAVFTTGTSGACTLTITPAASSINGWGCFDSTLTLKQTGETSANCTMSGVVVGGSKYWVAVIGH